MDEIYDKVMHGLPLDDIQVIDCHNHIGHWHGFHIPAHSAEDMLISMNALGIDKVFISAHSSIGPDYIYGNNMVIQTVKKYPDRFIGYAVVNPNYSYDIICELERCFKIPQIKGIKIHPASHGTTIDDENYHSAYEYADVYKCPVLIHVWGKQDVAAIERVAGKYSKARLIMGHAGAEIKAMKYALDVVKNNENVYVDLALSRAYEGNVEWFVSEVGSKKILFGTDMPFYDPRPVVGRVAMANISVEDKVNIFGKNMSKLLGIENK